MAIVRVKDPKSGEWKVLEVGAATGKASKEAYGVVKLGRNIEEGDTGIEASGETVYFGDTTPPEPTEEDPYICSYNVWFDPSEDQLPDVYHPDWENNDRQSSNYILNKPVLSTVATSGSYNDLKDKPEERFASIEYDLDELENTVGALTTIPGEIRSGDVTSSIGNLYNIATVNRSNIAQNTADIETNRENIAENTEDIAELEAKVGDLGKALVFVGIATVEIEDGSTTNPEITGYDFSKVRVGDVVISNDGVKEFVWGPNSETSANAWELIGPDSGFAPLGHTHTLSEITDWGPAGKSTEETPKLGGVIVDDDTIHIDENGVISSASRYELPIASKEDAEDPKLGGIIVGNHLDIDEETGVLRVDDDVIHIINQSLTFHHYINHENIKIKGGDDFATATQICTMTCHIDVLCTPIFIVTIPFTMDVDGTVEIYFVLNNHASSQTIKQYCQKGDNVITFMNYWTGILDADYHVELYARTYCEETEVRVNTAKVDAVISTLQTATTLPQTISYTVDTTVPTMFIKDSTERAVIFAQGIDEEEPWDGTFWINEQLGLDLFDTNAQVEVVQTENLKTTATTFFPDPTTGAYYDNLAGIMDVKAVTIEMDTSHLSASPTVEFSVSKGYIRIKDADNYTYNRDYINTLAGDFRLQTNYNYTSSEEEIDEGKLSVVGVDKSLFSSISTIEVN